MSAQPEDTAGKAAGKLPISSDLLLRSMTDTVLVLDASARWVWAAPTLVQEAEPARRRVEWLIGKRIPEVIEDAETAERLISTLNAALSTGRIQHVDYGVDMWGQTRWFSAAVTCLDQGHVLWVARDITDRVNASRLLEESVEERTREVNALLEVSHALSWATTLAELAAAILKQLGRVINTTGSAVVRMEGTQMTVLDSIGPGGREDELIGARLDMKVAPDWWASLSDGKPVVVHDAQAGEGRAFRTLLAGYEELSSISYIRSWMAVPLVHEGRLLGMISLSKDTPDYFTQHHVDLATAVARQAAVAFENASLFEQTRRRSRELDALLDVSRALASTLDLKPLLELILDRLEEFVPYAGAAISLLEGDAMRQVVVRRPRGGPVTPDDTRRTFPVRAYERMIVGEPVIINDVRGDDPLAVTYREPYGGSLEGTPVEYVKSFVSFPLVSRGETVGTLTMAHDEVGFFTPELVETLRPLADTAAIAIANAELFQRIDRRTRELAALLEVSRTVASTLDPGEVLGAILDQLGEITEHTGASILLVREDSFEFVEARSVTGARAQTGARIPFHAAPELSAAMVRGETVIIDDIRADDPMAAGYRAAIDSIGLREQLPFSVIRSWMAVPLALKESVIGVLTVSWTEPAYFTADHARLARAFADQAVVAMENARLFERAGQVAAVEERQRLARELHDSVSQALYGIALGARTAREQLDRDPAKAADPVEYVLSLAEAGLAEMRALIFELRPESLESEGLVAAIEKQAAALAARHRLEVTRDLCDEPDVPLPVKEAAYRIVQEAFNNIMKHAGAGSVVVRLAHSEGRITVQVADDGRGFDPSADYAGHLGLRSMRERAVKVDGDLIIDSSTGSGTRITAILPSS